MQEAQPRRVGALVIWPQLLFFVFFLNQARCCCTASVLETMGDAMDAHTCAEPTLSDEA